MRVMLAAIGALMVVNAAAQIAIFIGILPSGWMPGGY